MNNAEALKVIEEGIVGTRRHEAIKLAKKALARQIPAKPYNDAYCPLCDFYVGDINDDHFLYCPMCGQRIDFEEFKKPSIESES